MSGVNADEITVEGMGEVDERGWDPAAHWEQIYESNGISGAPSLGGGMNFWGLGVGLIASLAVVLA